jgi:hypothetical protein
MNKNLIASLVVAATALVAVPAFASGYGPAPHYNPLVGAPVSEQGQNTQTIAADNARSTGDVNAYGGRESLAQSGSSRSANKSQAVFFGQ